jgi:hypothetical protein
MAVDRLVDFGNDLDAPHGRVCPAPPMFPGEKFVEKNDGERLGIRQRLMARIPGGRR